MRGAATSTLRFGAVYSAIFLGSGAVAPYIPVWFEDRGLNGAQIGLILALPMLARTFTAPALALWADRFALRRTPLALLALVTAAAYAALAPPLGFLGYALLWFVAATLFGALPPLTDVVVLARARQEGFDYGWPRGIGSAAFIVANVAAGALLVAAGPDSVLVWIVVSALLTALSAQLLMPPDRVATHEAPRRLADQLSGVGELLRTPGYVLAVLAAGLIQSAHSFYYSFSALTWKAQGISEDLTGVLWGAGVAVEIGFLWFMEPWRRRVGPEGLLVLGAAASVVRWTAYAFAPPLWLLFPLQGLHALCYAATFIASLQLAERYSTPANATAAQMINAAMSGGLLVGLATMASGALFDWVGLKGYLLMSVISLAGLAAALRLARTSPRRG
ncbi:MAG: MFS transporter [Phenylobacterium sp.]